MTLAEEKPAEVKPHYLGHRERMRERFLKSDPATFQDYEILEMILFGARPRGDVKPLAKELIKRFGSLGGVINADAGELAKFKGAGESVITALRLVKVSASFMMREEMRKKPVIDSWKVLLDYCRTNMGHLKIEEFRVLFLDTKNQLIADELQNKGTVDHTIAYPREVAKRGLELGAAAMILVHNHPSGDPKPSKADIEMTKRIVEAVTPLNMSVHDHLIIAGDDYYSFKSHGLV